MPGYKCRTCSAVFPSRYKINYHYKKSIKCKGNPCIPGVHYNHLTCNICGDPEVPSINRIEHLKTHYGEMDMQDELLCCGMRFDNLRGLKTHQSQKHFDNETKEAAVKKKYIFKPQRKTTTCSICSKVYTHANSNFTMRYHMELEHGQEPRYACGTCGRPCTSPADLNQHLTTHMSKTERQQLVNKEKQESFLCPTCGGLYSDAGSLQRHMSNVHGRHKLTTKPSVNICPKCGKQLKDLPNYKKHLKLHYLEDNGVCPFPCKKCPMKFSSKIGLRYHATECPAEAHLRPFECPAEKCQRRFKLKHALELHLYEFHKFSAEIAREMVYPGLGPRQVGLDQVRKRFPVKSLNKEQCK